MRILNLGCGTKVSAMPNVINIDWSIYLRLKRYRLTRALAPVVLDGQRRQRFLALPDNIMVHNLAKGLPFASDSVDVVYHSHMLEHLDRDVARLFLREVLRVLKPGGIQRVVVPDFECLCRAYLAFLDSPTAETATLEEREYYIARIIEQSVRGEGYGTRSQRPLRRLVENLVLGDARRRGETHQWMYDKHSLCSLLRELGYHNPTVEAYNTSRIPDWHRHGLDVDANGQQYKRDSLYIEAEKNQEQKN